ncbi:MAG: Trk system potassium transporter TrkA [Dehalococcoidales bacterium]|nr:Trk system potassium transporter TrkA [Dehalococcoidales bacterium]
MYIIIAGGGIIGSHIASLLVQEGYEVTVLEQSETALKKLQGQLDIKTIRGNAATPKTLKEAEIERADLVLAVTNSDETNMITCFMAKEMGVATTAARIRNIEYSGYFVAPAKSPTSPRKIVRPKSLGIDVFINPEVEAAREIMEILAGFYSTPVDNFANGLVQIREFKIESEPLAGTRLGALTLPKQSMIVTAVHQGEITAPDKDFILNEGDSLHIAVSAENMDELGKIFIQSKRPAKRVVILGGSSVGVLTASGLQKRGIKVKIIEQDPVRCQELASQLEKVDILQGDGTDRAFLLEQGVSSADAFVATSENEEINILSALLAKTLGVQRVMVVVNKPGYIPLAEAIGIDIAAVPTILAANKIIRFVLRGGVISASLIEGQQLEAIEFVTSAQALIANKNIAEAGFPREATVVAIVHNETIFIPPEDKIIKPGDHVVIVTPPESVQTIEKLFK